VDIQRYLDRIHYQGNLDVNLDTLTELQRAHLHNIPFESLDIYLGNRIRLDLERVYDKVVQKRRGGFCYELNALFGWLLENIGFQVTQLSGRVMNGQKLGREFAHMLLMVDLQGIWITDVGFGDSFVDPLKLEPIRVQQQQTGTYRFSVSENTIILQQEVESKWEHKYQFTLTARNYMDFSEMCVYQQTSVDSYFARGPICTILSPHGRITLSGRRLIFTSEDKRNEKSIDSLSEYRQSLHHYFGINLNLYEIEKLYEVNSL